MTSMVRIVRSEMQCTSQLPENNQVELLKQIIMEILSFKVIDLKKAEYNPIKNQDIIIKDVIGAK